MRISTTLAISCVLAFGLAGCGDNAEETKHSTAAGGEVLPGSISDDMLPYDTVRSQPPLLKPPKDSDAAGTDSEAAEETIEETGEENDAETPEAGSEEEQQEGGVEEVVPTEEATPAEE